MYIDEDRPENLFDLEADESEDEETDEEGYPLGQGEGYHLLVDQ